jgi:hypothetical protein
VTDVGVVQAQGEHVEARVAIDDTTNIDFARRIPISQVSIIISNGTRPK